MKITCLEEHAIDSSLAQATRQAVAAEAPYMADLEDRVEDTPDQHPNDRPFLVSTKTTLARAAAPGH